MDELKKENIIPFDKLIPLYKYVDIPTAKLILAGSTIKYSTPKELNANDFDEQRFDVNCTNDYLEAMKRKAFVIVIMKRKSCDENRAVEYLNTDAELIREYNAYPNKKVYDFIESSYKYDAINSAGLFCVTTSNIDKEMWEHYGKNDNNGGDANAGVCIEFSFPSLVNDEFMAFEVVYDKDNKPFQFSTVDGKRNNADIYKWAISKPEKYSFEKEIRLLLSDLRPGIKNIDKQIITAVYYGTETSQTDIQSVDDIIDKSGYSFKKGQKITNIF